MARLNVAQRIVIVVGLGIGLAFFGHWVTNLGVHRVGWLSYAPLSRTVYALPQGGLHPWARLLIWLVLTALWLGASLALLRSRTTAS